MAKMTPEKAVRKHEQRMHPGETPSFKAGGSVSLPDAGYPQTGIKTSGIKTRGNGAATKGTMARGPMA